jgi:hypothetical protein
MRLTDNDPTFLLADSNAMAVMVQKTAVSKAASSPLDAAKFIKAVENIMVYKLLIDYPKSTSLLFGCANVSIVIKKIILSVTLRLT